MAEYYKRNYQQNKNIYDIRCIAHIINLVARDILNLFISNKETQQRLENEFLNTSIYVSTEADEFISNNITNNLQDFEEENNLPASTEVLRSKL